MARTDPQIKIYVPAELKGKIEEAAKASNRFVNAEIVSRLTDSLWLYDKVRDLSTELEAVRKEITSVKQGALAAELNRIEMELELGKVTEKLEKSYASQRSWLPRLIQVQIAERAKACGRDFDDEMLRLIEVGLHAPEEIKRLRAGIDAQHHLLKVTGSMMKELAGLAAPSTAQSPLMGLLAKIGEGLAGGDMKSAVDGALDLVRYGVEVGVLDPSEAAKADADSPAPLQIRRMTLDELIEEAERAVASGLHNSEVEVQIRTIADYLVEGNPTKAMRRKLQSLQERLIALRRVKA